MTGPAEAGHRRTSATATENCHKSRTETEIHSNGRQKNRCRDTHKHADTQTKIDTKTDTEKETESESKAKKTDGGGATVRVRGRGNKTGSESRSRSRQRPRHRPRQRQREKSGVGVGFGARVGPRRVDTGATTDGNCLQAGPFVFNCQKNSYESGPFTNPRCAQIMCFCMCFFLVSLLSPRIQFQLIVNGKHYASCSLESFLRLPNQMFHRPFILANMVEKE